MTDPITDMFNRIKNAEAVFNDSVEMPYSEVKMRIAEILKDNGFIIDCKKRGAKSSKVIKIDLKYEKQQPGILGFKRISKPGQRIYGQRHSIKRVKDGYGLAVVSTPRGLMTDQTARKAKLGGEIMIEVW
jgi:small subunit ribosomal protein S8